MASLKAVKQQLKAWERSDTRILLFFSQRMQFRLDLCGKIGCGMKCHYFEVIAPDAGRFLSPELWAFRVVFLGPDPKHDNLTTIKLRHRTRPWEIELFEVEQELTLKELREAAKAFFASKKPN
jgi:hypothetical protein